MEPRLLQGEPFGLSLRKTKTGRPHVVCSVLTEILGMKLRFYSLFYYLSGIFTASMIWSIWITNYTCTNQAYNCIKIPDQVFHQIEPNGLTSAQQQNRELQLENRKQQAPILSIDKLHNEFLAQFHFQDELGDDRLKIASSVSDAKIPTEYLLRSSANCLSEVCGFCQEICSVMHAEYNGFNDISLMHAIGYSCGKISNKALASKCNGIQFVWNPSSKPNLCANIQMCTATEIELIERVGLEQINQKCGKEFKHLKDVSYALEHIGEIMKHEGDISFSFGKNWLSFITTLSEEHIQSAKNDFETKKHFFNVNGKTVIDIGSGSGLSSYVIWSLGASSLLSMDFDPNSVEATMQMRQIYGKDPSNWRVVHGSVLDDGFMSNLAAKFERVYSWGVLHHTGDMWHAIRNAANCVKPGGLFWLALYAKGPRYPEDLALKKKFNQASNKEKFDMIQKSFETTLGHRKNEPNPYIRERGMNILHDEIDWLGGLPYEVAYIEEVDRFLEPMGFICIWKLEREEQGNHEMIYELKH